jgi:spermidine synthase
MKITRLLDQAKTPDGKPITLHERDGVYTIRIETAELMSTRHHHSEEKIAELACLPLQGVEGARVLIGGLGFGFTLRASLKLLPKDAEVTVAEIMDCVIKWNKVPAYGLSHDAIADQRTKLVHADVAKVIADNPKGFDTIILDIDNGATAMSASGNQKIYQSHGLQAARKAIRGKGCLAVWSAGEDPKFANQMEKCGFDVSVEKASAHLGGGGWNILYIGRAR